MGKKYLEAGKIVRSHGVRGELVLEPWADSAEFLKKIKRFWFDEGKTDAGFLSSRVHQGRLLLCLEHVDTVDKAEALRGKVLYLCREDVSLKPGTYFLQDLLGLAAVDGKTGRKYGMLQEVIPTGANDVYRIVGEQGQEYLFPAVPHMIQRIAPEEGVIELLPIPGIFDGEEVEA
ncbi:MAG: 16S rRNA processing protein RimM [Acutalibacter sp.]|nr:16S rRNA processing protein RimM [Acutalibacter sp.]